MSRFLGRNKLTEKQSKALEALRELHDAEGVDGVTQVYAEAVSKHREAGYIKRHRLKYAPVNKQCSCFFLWGKCHGACDRLADHAALFNREGKPSIYTAQPYHLDLEDMRKF